jgi:hypothetical protein
VLMFRAQFNDFDRESSIGAQARRNQGHALQLLRVNTIARQLHLDEPVTALPIDTQAGSVANKYGLNVRPSAVCRARPVCQEWIVVIVF